MSSKNPQNVKDFTRIILDNITDGVFTINSDMCITSFKPSSRKNYRRSKKESPG